MRASEPAAEILSDSEGGVEGSLAAKIEGLQILSNLKAASDARPVSRILYGVAAADGHSSRPLIAERLKRPTRKLRRLAGYEPAAEILSDYKEESKDLSP